MAGVQKHDRSALVPAICDRLATGEPLTVICRDLGISRYTIRNWRVEDPDIGRQFDQARDDGYDAIADDCLNIADDGRRDYKVDEDENGNVRLTVDHDHIQRSRLRVETRLKLLAKWDPRRYGDKIDHNHSGRVSLEAIVAGPESDE